MHGQILGQLLVAADHVDQDADLGAAITWWPACPWLRRGRSGGSTCFRRSCRPGRNRWIRPCPRPGAGGQGGDVGRILARHQVGTTPGQRQELVVLGDEVGFAIDFDRGADLPSADRTCRPRLRPRRGRPLLALLPSLTRRISSALAMSPSASVKAFLHSIMACVGLATQFCHHACGDCRHTSSPNFQTGGPGAPP